MAAPSNLPSDGRAEPHGSPYCSDQNCQSCKELREVQDAIRLHQPIPGKKLG